MFFLKSSLVFEAKGAQPAVSPVAVPASVRYAPRAGPVRRTSSVRTPGVGLIQAMRLRPSSQVDPQLPLCLSFLYVNKTSRRISASHNCVAHFWIFVQDLNLAMMLARTTLRSAGRTLNATLRGRARPGVCFASTKAGTRPPPSAGLVSLAIGGAFVAGYVRFTFPLPRLS